MVMIFTIGLIGVYFLIGLIIEEESWYRVAPLFRHKSKAAITLAKLMMISTWPGLVLAQLKDRA